MKDGRLIPAPRRHILRADQTTEVGFTDASWTQAQFAQVDATAARSCFGELRSVCRTDAAPSQSIGRSWHAHIGQSSQNPGAAIGGI